MSKEDEIYLKEELRRKDMEIQIILKLLLITNQTLDTVSLYLQENYPAEYQSIFNIVKKNKDYLDTKGMF